MTVISGNKKYELLDSDTVKSIDGRTLKRIRALVAIASIGVQSGDLGGYIEAEGNLQVSGNAWVSGDAQVSGNAWVSGDAQVSGNARVDLDIHVGWFSRVGSENGTLTWFRSESGIRVNRGCFNGTLNEFESAVAETHKDNVTAREYQCLIEFIRLRSAGFSNEGADA